MFHCKRAYETLEVMNGGSVYLCCPGYGNLCLGSLFQNTLRELWQNEKALAIRRSIFDGSFRFCDRCVYLPGPWRAIVPTTEFSVVPDRIPKLTIAYDQTCNLLCPTCRSKPRHSPQADTITDRLLSSGFLDDVDRLKFLGSGEPFSAPTFWRFVREFPWAKRPDLRVKLHTNARLLTPSRWEKLLDVRERVDEVFVSIDAATPETYAQNRPGVNRDDRDAFSVLVENLHFISSLKLKRFVLGFVVQRNNYQEMPAFVDLGRVVGASAVRFTKLRNWFSGIDFVARSVQPTEIVQMLCHSKLRDSIVELEHFAEI